MQERSRGTESRDCLKPLVPVQSLGQARSKSPQHQAGPSPSSQRLLSPDEGVKSSTWHLPKPAHFTPIEWELSLTPPPRGSGFQPAGIRQTHHSSEHRSALEGWSLLQSAQSITAAADPAALPSSDTSQTLAPYLGDTDGKDTRHAAALA